MRIFSYRNKRALRRALWIVLGVIALALILFVCRLVYLGRFVVYEDGAIHFDYEQKLTPTGVSPETLDPAEYPFETVLNGTADEDEAQQMTKLSGYYISTRMLARGVDEVREALSEVQDYNAVVIDVKSVFGNFYYSTEITGASTASADVVDLTEVDKLISDLTAQPNLTVIARVPAFSDPVYALAHQTQGLPLYSGALWMDDNDCYWLNPYSNGVQGYLSSIGLELAQLGFDEVLYDDFYFPADDRIAWTTDAITKEGAVADAAEHIKDNLFGNDLLVSFGSRQQDVAAFADRIYITTDDPSDAAALTSEMQEIFQDTSMQIVFVTDSRDTRFEECGVIRPLFQTGD